MRTNLYIIKIVQNETFNCKYNESEQGKILKTKTVCNKSFFFKVRTNGFFGFLLFAVAFSNAEDEVCHAYDGEYFRGVPNLVMQPCVYCTDTSQVPSPE